MRRWRCRRWRHTVIGDGRWGRWRPQHTNTHSRRESILLSKNSWSDFSMGMSQPMRQRHSHTHTHTNQTEFNSLFFRISNQDGQDFCCLSVSIFWWLKQMVLLRLWIRHVMGAWSSWRCNIRPAHKQRTDIRTDGQRQREGERASCDVYCNVLQRFSLYFFANLNWFYVRRPHRRWLDIRAKFHMNISNNHLQIHN